MWQTSNAFFIGVFFGIVFTGLSYLIIYANTVPYNDYSTKQVVLAAQCPPIVKCPTTTTTTLQDITTTEITSTEITSTKGPATQMPLQTRSSKEIPITFITTPRPFEGEIGIRQRQGIAQWLLDKHIEVVLVGDAKGAAALCQEWACIHEPRIDRDEDGIETIDSVLKYGEARASHDVICFINADIILGANWMKWVQATLQWLVSTDQQFLIAGLRYVFPIGRVPVPNVCNENLHTWERHHLKHHKPPKMNAIDFFIFRKGAYTNVMPPFRVGRYAWDNWMVAYASRQKWITVSGGFRPPVLYVLHPDHTRHHQHELVENKDVGAHNRWLAQQAGGWGGGYVNALEWVLGKCPRKTIQQKSVNTSLANAKLLKAKPLKAKLSFFAKNGIKKLKNEMCAIKQK